VNKDSNSSKFIDHVSFLFLGGNNLELLGIAPLIKGLDLCYGKWGSKNTTSSPGLSKIYIVSKIIPLAPLEI